MPTPNSYTPTLRGITIRKQREATFCALIIKDTSQRIALMEGAKYKNEK